MKKFNREAFENLSAKQYSDINLADGTQLCVRHLSVAEVRDLFVTGKHAKGDPINNIKKTDKMLAISVVDPDTKEPIFNEEEIQKLPAQVVSELVEKVIEVNGINKKDKSEEGN